MARAPSVLYLCPDLGIPVRGSKGGAVHVREMVAAFSRAGCRVAVGAAADVGAADETPREVAGEFFHLRAPDWVGEAAGALTAYLSGFEHGGSLARDTQRMLYDTQLLRLLRERFAGAPPDFIYMRSALFSLAPLEFARALRCPLLLEVNAPLAEEQVRYRGGALRELGAEAEGRLLRGADAVLVVSAALRGFVEGHGVEPARVHVFPNGVDPGVFGPGTPDPALRERFGIPAGPVLGFVGGLRPWHGVEMLPDLLARLAPGHPDLTLVLVGDGPLRPQLEARLAELGLRQRAVFTGAVPHGEVPGLVRHFRIALAPYPPLQHDFYFSPLKLFEYMACGAVVVAPELGQIGDLVRQRENGMLYCAGDLDALAAACAEVLGDERLAQRLAAAGARTVLDNYTWDHNARRAIALAGALRSAAGG